MRSLCDSIKFNRIESLRAPSLQTYSAWQRFKRGSLQFETELVHNLPRRLLMAEFDEHNVSWLNSQARIYVTRGRADKDEFYESIVAGIAELCALVPEKLRKQLFWAWKGPCKEQ
jgi:hypothetical protein